MELRAATRNAGEDSWENYAQRRRDGNAASTNV